MIIKLYKPYTSTTRHKSTLDFSHLSKQKPEKSLLLKYNRAFGRNNQGRITCRHKGGGHKKRYRLIDFKRNKFNILGSLATIEYDPYRNANISLINYADGEKRYILHVETLKIGDKICAGLQCSISSGNAMPLKYIPIGTVIHNIELTPGKGGQLCRTAGGSAIILAKEKNFVIVRLSSKEMRLISENCIATIGKISNSDHYNISIGKAGRSRWLGIRPTVRGSAMNPVDHPHGGGTGKAPIGKRHPVTPWGRPTLGFKTRKKKNKSNLFILKLAKNK